MTDSAYVEPAATLESVSSTPSTHLRNLVAREKVTIPNGAAETTVAETKFVYDDQTEAACTVTSNVDPASGILMHDSTGGIDSNTSKPFLNNLGTSWKRRGNSRCTLRWLDTPSSWLVSGAVYDVAGNPTKKIDARGKQTTITYESPRYSHPFSVLNPLQHETVTTYDYSIGKPLTIRDANMATTTITYDVLERPLTVTGPTSFTQYIYNDATKTITTKVRQSGESANNFQYNDSEILYDGFGRTVTERRRVSGDGQWIVSTKKYDFAGRLWQTSNPVEEPATPSEITTTNYDALDRVTGVLYPDGASTTTDYIGNATVTTDPAGKKRRMESDGLGRLKSVAEAYGVASEVQYTYYEYNGLDKLKSVGQGVQTRTFEYDSLGRLKKADNVESKTIAGVQYSDTWTYDANGNPLTYTDPRGAVTNYSPAAMPLDDLGRVRQKTYGTLPAGVAATAATNYTYDTCTNGKGRVCSVVRGDTTVSFTYDAEGRVATSTQTTAGNAYPFSYEYWLNGALKKVTYPSLRTAEYALDAAGRVDGVTSKTVAATVEGYFAHGPPKTVRYGNAVEQRWEYNSRLQMRETEVVKGSQGLLTLIHGYGTANNGNVASQEIRAGGAIFTQSYGYDGLNRLTSVSETATGTSGTPWSQTYSYDRYGNRAVTASTHPVDFGTPQALDYYRAANNRMEKYFLNGSGAVALADTAHDQRGNLINHPHVGVMTYDAGHRTFLRRTTLSGYRGNS